MALPKYKRSRSNVKSHKANWKSKLQAPTLVDCPQCFSKKMIHRACTNCGYYKGKTVIATKVEG
ncbi:MAG TPA: 50S ribosomal protein L32 [bacterium]|nr:50S ribosomal protein L32 [bacterium]